QTAPPADISYSTIKGYELVWVCGAYLNGMSRCFGEGRGLISLRDWSSGVAARRGSRSLHHLIVLLVPDELQRESLCMRGLALIYFVMSENQCQRQCHKLGEVYLPA